MKLRSFNDVLISDWALCLETNTGDLVGVAVRNAEGSGYRVVIVDADRNRFEVYDAIRFSENIACIPLPPCPCRTGLLTYLAYVSLGAKETVLSGLVRPPGSKGPRGDSRIESQWWLLLFVQAFGVECKGAEARALELLGAEPAMSAGGRIAHLRLLTSLLNLRRSAFEPLSVLSKERPFPVRPLASDFEINPGIPVPPRNRTSVRAFRRPESGYVLDLMRKDIERDGNGQVVPQSPFDEHDLEEAQKELLLASGGDQLTGPVSTAGGHHYAAAEYWVAIQDTDIGETISGCVGLLTFYDAENEPWIGYLCQNGALLTDVLLRRARDYGFETVYVWTTSDNCGAVKFYDDTGFKETEKRPREIAVNDKKFKAFQHAVAAAIVCEFRVQPRG